MYTCVTLRDAKHGASAAGRVLHMTHEHVPAGHSVVLVTSLASVPADSLLS